jgi:hypothetical protein
MNSLIQLKNTTPLSLIALVLGCIALSPKVQAQLTSPIAAQTKWRVLFKTTRGAPWLSTATLTLYLMLSALCAHAQEPKIEVSKGIEFTGLPNWSRSEVKYRNALELIVAAEGQKAGVQAVMTITTEHRRNHAEAVQRLAEIAAEIKAPVEFLAISGWPALQRQYTAPLERTGQGGVRDKEPITPQQLSLRTTTAIAVEDTVVQFQTTLAPEANPKLADESKAMARTAMMAAKVKPAETERDLQRLRTQPLKPQASGSQRTKARRTARKRSATSYQQPRSKGPLPNGMVGITMPKGMVGITTTVTSYQQPKSKGPLPKGMIGIAATVQTGNGELEVAASADGQTVVVAANSGYSNSIDGGQSFTFRGGTPGAFPRDGDPSLAVGASGAFYYCFIGFPNGTAAALNVSGCSNSIGRSIDSGVTFPVVAHAVLCPQTGANICFPDQEHIAADRLNSASGSDQVYNVWRNFLPVGTPPPTCSGITSGIPTAALVCSMNNGSTWTAPTLMPGGSDFPRVAVGPDGAVYVVYRSGVHVMLNKFSSCASGLTQQVGFPATVATFTDVTCPVAGLDRCNDGNVLSSPSVAVDSTNANHVYVAYSTNTASGNENIVVKDSVDGGANWPRAQNVNSNATGRRYMPWVCALGGTAFVSWYDRRAASTSNPDRTNYFLGSVFATPAGLQAGGEENLSVNPDPECTTGFPCGARSSNDFTACSTTGSLGSGCPKYGDYNGNGSAGGRVYIAWASATAPPGLPAPSGITLYASAASRIYFTDAKQTTGSVYELIGTNPTAIFTFSGALAGNRAYHSAFDPRTGKLYVSNSNQFKLFAVDSTTGAAGAVFTHTTYLRDIAFDPAGNLYFSEATGAGADGKIYRLDLTSGLATVFYSVLLSSVGGFWAGDFTFAPDGHLYISTGNVVGGQVYRVDNPSAASPPISVYSIAGESVTGIAFDRYGRFYYSNWDGTAGHIYQLNLSTGTRQLLFSSPGAWIWDVSFR